jgi:hypothetical protein
MKTTLENAVRALALLAAFTVAPAHGRECKGVNFPDQTQAAGSALVLNGLGLSQASAFIEKLKGWMTDIKTGQRLAFVAKPGAGIEVNVNGTIKGMIEGDDFAKALFSIWLGAAPPNRGLKAGLLGGVCG